MNTLFVKMCSEFTYLFRSGVVNASGKVDKGEFARFSWSYITKPDGSILEENQSTLAERIKWVYPYITVDYKILLAERADKIFIDADNIRATVIALKGLQNCRPEGEPINLYLVLGEDYEPYDDVFLGTEPSRISQTDLMKFTSTEEIESSTSPTQKFINALNDIFGVRRNWTRSTATSKKWTIAPSNARNKADRPAAVLLSMSNLAGDELAGLQKFEN